uniref:Uncharacterized protein n=1 Tax=Rhizophora mucronata TaxID=61149 RepID=A0A2P2NHI1_RHIMU
MRFHSAEQNLRMFLRFSRT